MAFRFRSTTWINPVVNPTRFREQLKGYFDDFERQASSLLSDLEKADDKIGEDLSAHIGDLGNPHEVTYDQTGAAPFVHTHPWDEITDKPTEFPPEDHTHPWEEVTGKPTEYPPEDHTHVEADITDLNRVRFRKEWIDGGSYLLNDWAWEGVYEGVANKATGDHLAPQDVGDPAYVYQGTISSIAIPAKQALYGVRYTTQTGGFKVEGYRLDVVGGNAYAVFLIEDPLGEPILSELGDFEPSTDGWIELAVNGGVVPEGTTFDLLVRVNEPDPETVSYTLNYDYDTPNNTSNPGTGLISHANKERDVLRVNKTDRNGDPTGTLPDDPDGDQTPFDWALIGVGDIISGAGMRWSVQDVTDNGTWIGFSVAPQDQGSDGIGDFTFETVIVGSITVPRDADLNYWDTVGYAGVSGLFFQDAPYDPNVTNRSAYGIDLLVQQVSFSPDWDLLPQSGGVGGEAPSAPGVTTFEALTDTPVGYAGQAGKSVIVNPAEDGLEYGDASSDGYVLKAGDTMEGELVGPLLGETWSPTFTIPGYPEDVGGSDYTFSYSLAAGTRNFLPIIRKDSQGNLWSAHAHIPSSSATVDDLTSTSLLNKKLGDQLYGDSGGSLTYGSTFPADPTLGDAHYLTVAPVGLYIRHGAPDDPDSEQWVSADQSSTVASDPGGSDDYVLKAGDTMTGPLEVPSTLDIRGTGGTALRMTHTGTTDGNGGSYMSWYGADNVRRGYLGYASTVTSSFTISNEVAAGDVRIVALGSASSGNSAINRTRGDARYLRSTGGVTNASQTVSGTFTVNRTDTTSALRVSTNSGKSAYIAFRSGSTDQLLVGQQTSGSRAAIKYNGASKAESFYFLSDGSVRSPAIYKTTTGSSANMFSSSNHSLYRSTSSGKWKSDRRRLSAEKADAIGAVVDDLNPLIFKSDHPEDEGRDFTGFIAEEVNETIPSAIENEGENYDLRAVVAYLTAELQSVRKRLAELEAENGT